MCDFLDGFLEVILSFVLGFSCGRQDQEHMSQIISEKPYFTKSSLIRVNITHTESLTIQIMQQS